jgi:hypothetical protein
VPVAKGKTLEGVLATTDIPAAINADVNHPDVKPLTPDATQAGFEAQRTRGHTRSTASIIFRFGSTPSSLPVAGRDGLSGHALRPPSVTPVCAASWRFA